VIVDDCCSSNCIEILCPTNLVVPCQQTAGPPGAFVTLPPPRATNHCGDHVLPTTQQWRCTPPPASPNQPVFFPPGTNTVVWCLYDGAAQIDCCCFDVIVVNCPTQPSNCRPQIICPTNIQVQCEGHNGAIVFFPPPRVIDPCGLVTATNCTAVSGTFFPNGKTTVACCITWMDPATGKQEYECCCFEVIVRCCQPCETTLRCPPDMTIDCPGASGYVLNYSAFGTNTCEPTVLDCFPPPGAVIYGATNVCCVLKTTSGVFLDRCCFKVNVNDTTPPVIDCPPDITVISSNCRPVAVAIPVVGAKDNCDPNPTVTCTPILNAYPCGTTAITCTATDSAGNAASCTFKVIIVCPGGTEIICPPDIFVECAAPTGVVVNYSVQVTNRCTNIVSVSCTPPSGSVFAPGFHTVCCTAADANKETNQCCFKVTVLADTVTPQITCPSNIVVISPNCTPIDVLYPAPTASDNCQLDHVTCTPPSGSLFTIGTTPVVCCAVDKAGNSNCCNFTVTVRCPPNDCVQVICPSNIVVDCAGPNGAVVNYSAHAIDTCTGALLPIVCSKPPGNFPTGTTTVCCTNVTAGVAKWCCFTVTVNRDTVPPVINCPTNIYVFCAKPNGTKVNYTVTATDNCTAAVSITCVPPSGSHFPIGCTNVTCTAADSAGNASSYTFKICVLPQGCYVQNPSFELLNANLPAPNACGDPINFAVGWSAVGGTPDLWRPPFASLAPGNCRGQERPCQGTNYAGLEGGYTTTGVFTTEAMMGTIIAPLANGPKFRLRACLSLAESSSGPVFLEFVLASSANPAQQQVIHQTWVTQKNGWVQYQPPCFMVPTNGNWDRLIIRAAQVPPTVAPYKVGYVYVDNVNICCCHGIIGPPILTDTTVTVVWDGRGQLQAARGLSDTIEWSDVNTPVEYDPETDTYRTTMPRPPSNLFFRVMSPDDTVGCSECGG
jgi:hypothetical protein